MAGTAGQRVTVWQPASKPQREFLRCPVEEVLFGGARGGGKTDAVLGEWGVHSGRYGSDAIGLIVRRTRLQLTETFERAKVLYKPLGATFTENPMRCLMPNGARLNFAYLERDSDAENYQGHSYCVAVGTMIVMGDGTRRPIEQIRAGDVVATLEGPRLVLAAVEPYLAPCVRAVVRDDAGAVLGEQIHPVWHPVLTTAGLSASHTFQTRQTGELSHCGQSARGKQAAGSRPGAGQGRRGWAAYAEAGHSGCRASSGECRDGQPPQSWSVPVVLHAPSAQSARERGHAAPAGATQCRSPGRLPQLWSGSRQAMKSALTDLLRPLEPALSEPGCGGRGLASVNAYAPHGSTTVLGSPGGYPSGRGSCGAQPRRAEETARLGTQSQADAGNTLHASPSDGSGTTQGRTHSAQLSWEHPYTGEARHLSEAVTFGTMEAEPIGEAWVADLCVAGANHYISDSGLINKNTRVYIEEAGNFPSPAPILKMMATLRSGAGVPCRMRLTANPGGPGHQWVKARYIDPAPMGNVVLTDPETGRKRVYIPSRITDNPFLGEDYIARLKSAGSPELVRAWLAGDWTVISGAFFPEFDPGRHIIAPRSLPEHWPRFRSFDWGSAKPFSVGWWAVSDGTLPDIARGALVRYREWYGMQPNEPNVGLKMTAEGIAQGIKAREKDDPKPMQGVADPAIFTEDGGPSIAQRMVSQGVIFRPADNKRVAGRGAIGGWDQLRERLRGDADGRPMLLFFSTCRDTIRTLPALQHDSARPEDVDTDNEDHAADEVRYACLSRPFVRDAKRDKPVDSWARAFARGRDTDGGDWKTA